MADLDSYGEEGVDCKGRKWERIDLNDFTLDDILSDKYLITEV